MRNSEIVIQSKFYTQLTTDQPILNQKLHNYQTTENNWQKRT